LKINILTVDTIDSIFKMVILCTCKNYDDPPNNCPGKDPSNDIIRASEKGDNRQIKELYEKGNCINVYTWYGSHTLHKAIYGGHYETVKLLVELGANIHRKSRTTSTPISLAINLRHHKILLLLLEFGA